MNAVNTSTKQERFPTRDGESHHHTGGVPENDTSQASPHALPIAPTSANGSGHPLEAILWGLRRAFMPNPSTFTSQRRKALRDAFFRFRRDLLPQPWRGRVASWPPSAGFGHGLARSAHGRLLCDTAMEGLRATPRRPFGIENLWMTTMCGWRLVFASGTICEGCSYSVIPTFSGCRATAATMLAAG